MQLVLVILQLLRLILILDLFGFFAPIYNISDVISDGICAKKDARNELNY